MTTLIERRLVRRPVIISGAPARATNPSSSSATASQDSKFKDRMGLPIWITMFDIIGLFHLSEREIKASRIAQAEKRRFAKPRMQKYWLRDVYGIAQRMRRPLAGTADEALDEFLEKLRRCGDGLVLGLPEYCECDPCEDMRSGGKSRAGQRFWSKQSMEFARAETEEFYGW
ncbi:hypothetical protein BDV96DRAFT_654821 [Lophiotrema nucula]|uniref:Uncharacterized protein n=1 Tax=Lophiotrema nucula TaxID=690887 RepID=A0A6A5YJE3_9PLEO|nr:hypothetical protein BDV96DRAFT_654821 [Lophiotrema nucula]